MQQQAAQAGEAATGVPAAAAAGTEGAESYEERHVHSVYERSAPHFSSTRYKPWPLVAAFLHAQPPGSVGLDVGCGNGKYLGVNPHVAILGSDRSAALVGLARERAWEGRPSDDAGNGATPAAVASEAVAVADGLALPFRTGAGGSGGGVDFVICVAVVHHLSTRERRVEGVRALLECLRDSAGKALVYVWALEQGNSRRGWDEGADQDQLVPWVMKTKKPRPKAKKSVGDGSEQEAPVTGEGQADGSGDGNDETYQRYYHLYRKGELEEDVMAAGGVVLESGYEKDNWWAIASRRFTPSVPSNA